MTGSGSRHATSIGRGRSLLRRAGILEALLAVLVMAASPSFGATLPSGFVESTVAGSWNEAVGMEFISSGRLFVWERGGRIWTVDGGVKSPTPFLDISDEVGGWRDFGLLGVALHPDFLNNGFIYLYYVVDQHHLLNAGTMAYQPGTNSYFAATQGRITRYQAIKGAPSDPDYANATTVDYGSRFVLHGDAIGTGCPILYESHGTGHADRKKKLRFRYVREVRVLSTRPEKPKGGLGGPTIGFTGSASQTPDLVALLTGSHSATIIC